MTSSRRVSEASVPTDRGRELLERRSPGRAGASRLRRFAAVFLIAGLALLASRCGPLASRPSAALVLDRSRGPVPPSYIGLHIHHAAAGTAWPEVPFASWRLWDTYAGWPWLEPKRGDWQWTALDRLIDLAGEHHVEVLLPLGLSPTWASARPEEPSAYGHPGFAAEPADLDDWRRYVEAVVSRYAGRVRLYEIWNEPNLPAFYSGDVTQMLRLCRAAHDAIKRIDPGARVVSPAATTTAGVAWLDRFLSAGGADCFDVVGFHLYVWPDPPEAIVPLVSRVQDVLRAHGIAGRPLWNTETGWYVARAQPAAGARDRPGALSETDAAAALARALILARAAGVERFYWYSWDSEDMGLAEPDGRLLAPGRALAEVERWLVGAELDRCERTDGTWICRVHRDGRAQWIAWHPDGRAELPAWPPRPIAAQHDLLGAARPVRRAARTIEIGPAPQLLDAAE